MDNLINELKDEHKIIISHLENANSNYGISPDIARQKLLLAKEVLLGHLKKEDEMLYPALYREAEKNSQLKSYLDIFARDMEKITSLAIKFFDKYEKQISSDFSNDLAEIAVELKQRIGKEERSLYKEYEKII